jgi:hypothetical protein
MREPRKHLDIHCDDCGELVGTKYAIAEGREICYACADRIEREELKNRGRPFIGYLEQEDARPLGRITTWTGGLLMNANVHRIRSGFGGEQWVIQATDVHGKRWYGRNGGPGLYCRLRPVSGTDEYPSAPKVSAPGNRDLERHPKMN